MVFKIKFPNEFNYPRLYLIKFLIVKVILS